MITVKKRVLTASLSYWLHSKTSAKNAELSSAVFKAWAYKRVMLLIEVVAEELTKISNASIFPLSVSQFSNLLKFVLHSVDIQEVNTDAMETDLPVKSVQQTVSLISLVSNILPLVMSHCQELSDLANLSITLLENSVLLQQGGAALACSLVERLSLLRPTVGCNPKHFIQNSLTVSRLVKVLWSKSSTHKQLILQSLQTLFRIVSTNENAESVSVSLSTILQLVPESMIDEVCKNLLSDTSVKDNQITNALRHMITWLQWPKHVNLHLWIIRLCFGLAETGRLIILFEITSEMAATVAQKLWYRNIQSTVLQVLITLLLFNQSCPMAFHGIIPILEKAFGEVKEVDIKEELSRLVQTLIYMHPGYPELYHPLSALLAEYEVLSETCMQEMVKKYSVSVYNTSKKFTAFASQSKVEKRVDKVGLENLGNTCFLNSVVQALYNIDSFQSAILSSEMSSTPLLRGLQTVFAFLQLTQRASLSPHSFVKASLPTWFVEGEQQDSSEYMRFLLDSIHEETDKVNRQLTLQSDQKLLDYTLSFTGSDTVTTRCEKCSTMSSSHQKFYDISLHFDEESSNTDILDLTDMLGKAFKDENLVGDNQFYCNSCAGLQDATRSLSGFSLPSCLVLTLCRFSYNVKLNKHIKIRAPVQYPSNLEILNKKYMLNAVIVHSGTSLNGGHYYTYARSLSSPSGQWYLFNDSRVTPCASPAELSSKTCKNSRLSSDTPYLLFYTDMDSVPSTPLVGAMVNPTLRQLVVRDDLSLLREVQAAAERKSAEKKACQGNILSWYSYTDDDDNIPPGADNSIDLSGSRFIF
ncbi:USP38 [Bugula neritina]|uniref:Ubiquitin carboxyl-terminal hydrolase n=1 Tax=Bugula neritina TaxID=10212 RepID=A0A7J7KDQ9_BUGNE|nr:USP38 [Bugula neritina]